MTQETALGAALKSAVHTMSKKKQTDMIEQQYALSQPNIREAIEKQDARRAEAAAAKAAQADAEPDAVEAAAVEHGQTAED